MNLIIPGVPIAKARPRFARIGKFIKTYKTEPQETAEGRFLWEVRQQWKGEPLDGPLAITIFFDMPRPRGHFGTGKNTAKLKDSAPQFHICRPDIDNLIKFCFDCLNGVVWKDDTQVFGLTARKSYADKPCTWIEIEKASGKDSK
jgi:Holliday junction resolvase RusA-like endonuclease